MAAYEEEEEDEEEEEEEEEEMEEMEVEDDDDDCCSMSVASSRTAEDQHCCNSACTSAAPRLRSDGSDAKRRRALAAKNDHATSGESERERERGYSIEREVYIERHIQRTTTVSRVREMKICH